MSGRREGKAGALTARVDGKSYLTAEGAARMLGVSRAFVLRMARRRVGADGVGLYPCSASTDGRFLYTREAVRRFAVAEPMPWLDVRKRQERDMEREERGGIDGTGGRRRHGPK